MEDYLGKFPNTYTFTKNLAETLLLNEYEDQNFTSAIVRPGIVYVSIKEPITGWVDSLNGISGAALMSAVGLAKNNRVDLDAYLYLIPVDTLANTCIIAAWTAATK